MSQGRRSWIPGSRAKPAPRNEPIPAFFRNLMVVLLHLLAFLSLPGPAMN